MTGAAMSLTAAASGFVVLLLTVPVVHGQDGWGVTYSLTKICAPKRSTVEIRCSYRYPSSKKSMVEKLLWFRKRRNDHYVDLKTDSDYTGRVQYLTDKNSCTLRIRDLRESDSAVYKFRFETRQKNGKYTGTPGVTLSVTDLQVQVRRSSPQVELKCNSSCPAGSASYVWYKNRQKMREETVSQKVSVNGDNNYSCAVKGHEDYCSCPVYPPKLPSVLVSPSGEIMEGALVNVTCNSDANPAANYTWYKKDGNPDLKPLSAKTLSVSSSVQYSDCGEYYSSVETKLRKRTSKTIFTDGKYAPKCPSVLISPTGHQSQLVFWSIQPSDSGEYYCAAENMLGRRTSACIYVNVTYAPKLPSVSVSPSGEIKEGSSVTLTCSSDANPAASCTWYNKSQKKLKGQDGVYHFTSLRSEDRGFYHCKCENQYGQVNSSHLLIDVQYAPKLPSVSVSPSAEIKEGSSVTLTCSSDANPAADYTWYKEDDDSAKASGQIFTITNIRAEHSGSYYCEAQNSRGRHSSTFHLTVRASSVKSAAAGSVAVIFLALIFLCAFVLFRRKKFLKQPPEPGEGPDNTAQQQDELFYASVSFSTNRQPNRHKTEEEEEDEEGVEYTVVNVKSATATPGLRRGEAVEDSFALYSTVSKKRRESAQQQSVSL